MTFCYNCGTHLEGDPAFCNNCRVAVKEAAQPSMVNHVRPSQPKRKKSKKSLIVILSSVAAVLALAACAAVYLVIESNRASSYEEAVALMNSGKHKEAQEIFVDLGRYNNAEALLLECRMAMDYNAAKLLMENGDYMKAKPAFELLGAHGDSYEMAVECQLIMDYEAAKVLMDGGNYTEAKTAFLALGRFRDSDAMVAKCQTEIDYSTATRHMESGDYEQARAVFVSLGSFKDSAQHAGECEKWIVYVEAMAQMDAGDHAAAMELLEPLAAVDFEESALHIIECGNAIGYAEAERAYNDGLFYTAFTMFKSLSGYNDADGRASRCIQAHPSSGPIYRNSNHQGSDMELIIETPKDDPRPTFVKIYTVDGTLVCSVFIRGGDSPAVLLPANTYMIKSAHGDTWYGPVEMFGDENAYYQTLLLEGNTTYAFRSNYSYTLTLRDAIDGNVDTRNESRTGF